MATKITAKSHCLNVHHALQVKKRWNSCLCLETMENLAYVSMFCFFYSQEKYPLAKSITIWYLPCFTFLTVVGKRGNPTVELWGLVIVFIMHLDFNVKQTEHTYTRHWSEEGTSFHGDSGHHYHSVQNSVFTWKLAKQ